MAKWEHPPDDEGANAYMVKVVIQCDHVFVVHADSLDEASKKADKFVNYRLVIRRCPRPVRCRRVLRPELRNEARIRR